jgi:hypothetical protein
MIRTVTARWGLVLALMLVGGCASEPKNEAGIPAPHDEATSALVSLASAHHKRADLALLQGDRPGAKGELRSLVETRLRHPPRNEAAWDVYFDASARLARLHLEDREVGEAEQAARAGLAGEEQAPATLFRGYLHQTLGDVLEQKGDPRGAIEEHGRAIEIFRSILDRADTGGR